LLCAHFGARAVSAPHAGFELSTANMLPAPRAVRGPCTSRRRAEKEWNKNKTPNNGSDWTCTILQQEAR